MSKETHTYQIISRDTKTGEETLEATRTGSNKEQVKDTANKDAGILSFLKRRRIIVVPV